MGTFAHGLAATTMALAALTWLRLEEQPSIGRWLACGAALGALTLTYWAGAIAILLPGITFVRRFSAAMTNRQIREMRQILLGAFGTAIMALLVFSPQMSIWQLLYGAPLTRPQETSAADFHVSHWLEMLFAPYGLAIWTPPLFIGTIALLGAARRHGIKALAPLVVCVLYFGYNSVLIDWHGSGAYGLRRLTLLAPFAALGLAWLFDKLARRRQAALAAAMIVGWAGWALLLMIRYDHYERRSPLMWHELPIADFYLSRNALPLWDIGRYLAGGYLSDLIRESSSAPSLYYLGVLIIAALGGLALIGLVTIRTPPISQDSR